MVVHKYKHLHLSSFIHRLVSYLADYFHKGFSLLIVFILVEILKSLSLQWMMYEGKKPLELVHHYAFGGSTNRVQPIHGSLIQLTTELAKFFVARSFVLRQKIRIRWKYLHLFIALSFLYFLNNSLYFYAFQLHHANIIPLLTHLRLPLTAILHHLLIKRQTELKVWISLIFLSIGIILTTHFNPQSNSHFYNQNQQERLNNYKFSSISSSHHLGHGFDYLEEQSYSYLNSKPYHESKTPTSSNIQPILIVGFFISLNSSLSSIYNEKLLKTLKMRFWEQQYCIYFLGSLMCCLYSYFTLNYHYYNHHFSNEGVPMNQLEFNNLKHTSNRSSQSYLKHTDFNAANTSSFVNSSSNASRKMSKYTDLIRWDQLQPMYCLSVFFLIFWSTLSGLTLGVLMKRMDNIVKLIGYAIATMISSNFIFLFFEQYHVNDIIQQNEQEDTKFNVNHDVKMKLIPLTDAKRNLNYFLMGGVILLASTAVYGSSLKKQMGTEFEKKRHDDFKKKLDEFQYKDGSNEELTLPVYYTDSYSPGKKPQIFEFYSNHCSYKTRLHESNLTTLFKVIVGLIFIELMMMTYINP